MARLETRRHILAALEDAWAVVSDFERQREWMVDIRSLRVVSEQKQGVGTVVEATSAIFGLPVIRDRIEVTAWDPPRRLDVRRRTPPAGLGRIALQGTGSFILEPKGDGTLFTWIEDVEVPFGPLGAVGWRVLIAPHMQWVCRRSLDNVERVAKDLAGKHGAE
jgi:hypothetical protein